MVFFFTCSDPRYVIYMGRDKFENEKLIEYGHPEDIWFHVDDMSSAHVYLRMPLHCTDMEAIPKAVMDEVCQLTKHNSIQGTKAAKVDICYTAWANLKKTQDMDVGQVGFKDYKLRLLVKHVEKDKDVIKRMEKTREEKDVDFRQMREERDTQVMKKKKLADKEMKRQLEEDKKAKLEAAKLKSYAGLFDDMGGADDHTTTRKAGTIDDCKAAEEDFFM
eukprot:GDKH01006133.1.p1 GENE.GDKH01006133.1~~GDKH01006133.1.p1  ORF type:complete len:219 (-),score=43.04 GDKH01006133.1:42-698(-)